MALFDRLFSKPAPERPRVTFQVPPSLPNLASGSAAGAAQRAAQPAAEIPAAPLPPPTYLAGLLGQQKVVEAVTFLAHSLPPRDAVRWAADSCAMVAPQQSPVDKAAAEASKRWAANPTDDNRQQALRLAGEANHAGPGAWAAQAAGLAGAPATPGEDPAIGRDLVGKAVAGSVMLAAAMSKPGFKLPVPGAPAALTMPGMPVAPAVPKLVMPAAASLAAPPVPAAASDELSALYKPFVDRGLALAAGAS